MRSRLGLARAGAVVAASAAALTLSTLPATAEPVSGHVDRDVAVQGYTINFQDDGNPETEDRAGTSLMRLDLGGNKSLLAYCVELTESVDHNRTMIEQDWDAYPDSAAPFNKNRGKINWILHHSYPAISLDAFAKALDNPGVELNKRLAVTATQAAIWHFSNGNLPLDAKEMLKGQSPEVWVDFLNVKDYLIDNAKPMAGQRPDPTLRIEPAVAKGEAGAPIGPISIASTGKVTIDSLDGLPQGTKFVDADGNELSKEQILDGAEFYIAIPAGADAGSAKVDLAATTSVDMGRLFVVEDYANKPAQSLIVASSDKTTVTDTAKISWTAAAGETTPGETTIPTTPTSDSPTSPSTTEAGAAAPSTTDNNMAKAETENLAYTGASIITPLLVGIGLLIVGGLALILVRRRKKV